MNPPTLPENAANRLKKPFPAYLDADTGELVPAGQGGVFSPSAVGGLIYIEQMTAPCPKINVPYLVGKNEKLRSAVVFKPRCKCWNCPVCAKVNADLWVMRTVYAADKLMSQGSGKLDFVTITSHERLSPKQTIELLPSVWSKIRKRLARAAPGVQFAAVPELTQSYRVHVHALVLAQLTKRWWKDNTRECGGGYQAEDEPVYSAAGAGFYIGKYLAKQFQNGLWKKGFHRVRTSRGWPKLPDLPRNPDWQFAVVSNRDSLESIYHRLALEGYGVALADWRSAWSVVDAI